MIYFLMIEHDTLIYLAGYSKSDAEDLTNTQYAKLVVMSSLCAAQIAKEKSSDIPAEQ